jgi:hypothetical protein
MHVNWGYVVIHCDNVDFTVKVGDTTHKNNRDNAIASAITHLSMIGIDAGKYNIRNFSFGGTLK